MSSNDRNNVSTLSKGRGATLSPIEYKNKAGRNLNNSNLGAMNPDEAYGMGMGANSQKALNPLSLKTVRK